MHHTRLLRTLRTAAMLLNLRLPPSYYVIRPHAEEVFTHPHMYWGYCTRPHFYAAMMTLIGPPTYYLGTPTYDYYSSKINHALPPASCQFNSNNNSVYIIRLSKMRQKKKA